MNRPRIKKDVDMDRIIRAVEGYMNEVDNGYISDDIIQYIFEDVMIAMYGEDVWKYVNEKIN
jgi:hypothetical protein